MSKTDDLTRARGLLTQALAATTNTLPNDRAVQEARMHMKKALNELAGAAKAQTKKRGAAQDEHSKWWGSVVAGVGRAAHAAVSHEGHAPVSREGHAPVSREGHAPVSREAQSRSLADLNAMIAHETQKLDDLERASAAPDPLADLLTG